MGEGRDIPPTISQAIYEALVNANSPSSANPYATIADIAGAGSVDSVFGRIGVVVAQSGDYVASQVDNDSGVSGADVAAALNTLASSIPSVPVDSVFGRTGVVIAATGDYDASQIDNDSSIAGVTVADALNNLIPTSEKGAANGVATLDASGRLPSAQLPTSAQEYKGVWDANTNTPALSSGVGTNGDTYRVSVAGSTNLDGITDWEVGDAAIFNGTLGSWQKLDNSDAVSSVFGRQGMVAAQSGDYDASQVDNDSGVAGATVADALDNLLATNPALATVLGVGNTSGGTDIVVSRGDKVTWLIGPGGSASIEENGTTVLYSASGPTDMEFRASSLGNMIFRGNGGLATGVYRMTTNGTVFTTIDVLATSNRQISFPDKSGTVELVEYEPPVISIGDGLAGPGLSTFVAGGAGWLLSFSTNGDDEFFLQVSLDHDGVSYDGSDLAIEIWGVAFNSIGGGTIVISATNVVRWQCDYFFGTGTGTDDLYNGVDGTTDDTIDISGRNSDRGYNDQLSPMTGKANARVLNLSLRRQTSGTANNWGSDYDVYGLKLVKV